MRGDPHKLVEGCLVAGRAMNATAGMSVSRYLQYHLTSLSIYLHPWRVLSGSITRRAGDPRGLQSRIDRQERLWIGLQFRRLPSPRSWRVHLWRGDGAHRVARGQAGEASAQAAIPGRRRAVRLPVDCCERGNCRGGTYDRAERRQVVCELWEGEELGDEGVLCQWACEQPVCRGGGDEHSVAGTVGEALWWDQGRMVEPQGDHPGRMLCTRHTARHLR